jgi:alpha-L-fucosidase
MPSIDDLAESGPFSPNWDSLKSVRVPAWYENGKFGIFVHWGLYSVPAFGSEWYPRKMYAKGSPEFEHHVKTYGPHEKFGYKDFIPLFKAERFDASEWMALFKESGAKFVVPVAEHHDGFPMYDCSFTKWSARKMGPKRDFVKELAAAAKKAGLVFGLSSHRAEHWFFLNGGMEFDSDVRNPKFADFYGPAKPDGTQPDKEFLDDWLARTCELIGKYDPQLLWFDWWIETPAFGRGHLQKLAACYYNYAASKGLEVALNYKFNACAPGTAVYDVERGSLSGIRPYFWQNDTAVAKNSWGHITNSPEGKGMDYKTPGDLIGDLLDVVSKNGALLLNVGPRSDGSIPEEDQKILRAIGTWLSVNGEAVYGTRPWKVYGEGPTGVVEGAFNDDKRGSFTARDMRFTCKGSKTLYASVLAKPAREIAVRSLGADMKLHEREIKKVSLLGHEGDLKFSRDSDALRVELPAKLPGAFAWTMKIES